MADQEEEKKTRKAQHAAARMRVLRAKKSASRMAQQELLAKLMFVEEEKKILQQELIVKRSCQQESLAPPGSPPKLCVTPPRGLKHVRSPTLGSGNGREKTNKLEQHESTPPMLPPDEVTPDKVTPDKVSWSTQVSPPSQRSPLTPFSVMRFIRSVEKVPPAQSTSLCTLLTVCVCVCVCVWCVCVPHRRRANGEGHIPLIKSPIRTDEVGRIGYTVRTESCFISSPRTTEARLRCIGPCC